MRPFWSSDTYNTTKEWEIVLPHQCDQWEIGTRDDARQLIADLQALIDGDDPPTSAKYEWRPLDDTVRKVDIE